MERSLPGETVSSILVFKQRNIGDVLLATPAIHALHVAWPEARIAVAVNSGTEEMIAGNPDVDRIIVFDRSARDAGRMRRWKEEVRFLREIRAWRPDLAVQLTEGDRGAIMAFLSGARRRAGVEPNRKGLRGKEKLFTHLCPRPPRLRHVVQNDLAVVAALGVPPADLSLRFHVPDEARARVREVLRSRGLAEADPYAVVHPGSRWTFKCWTDAGNVALLNHLASKGVRPVVTSGPNAAEVAHAGRILDVAGKTAVSLAGRLSFKELGALIASARLFVGADSAPMHVAAAVGTPVVAIFGPSGAFNWAPWEGLEWGHDLEHLGGSRFVGRHAVIQKDWECVPCGKDGCFGTKRSCCLEGVSVEEVTAAVDRILGAG